MLAEDLFHVKQCIIFSEILPFATGSEIDAPASVLQARRYYMNDVMPMGCENLITRQLQISC